MRYLRIPLKLWFLRHERSPLFFFLLVRIVKFCWKFCVLSKIRLGWCSLMLIRNQLKYWLSWNNGMFISVGLKWWTFFWCLCFLIIISIWHNHYFFLSLAIDFLLIFLEKLSLGRWPRLSLISDFDGNMRDVSNLRKRKLVWFICLIEYILTLIYHFLI